MGKSMMDIINSKITKIEKVYVDGIFDFWNISTDKCEIGVYNPIKYGETLDNLFELRETLETTENSLLNHYVINVVNKDEEYLMIELDNLQKIFISLKDDDFPSPEAAVVHFISGEIMVIS
jgi:hypothetical protein